MIERKIVLLKEASVNANGRLEGYGAVYGNLDDGGDVIEQKALAPAIPEFLKSGFISWGHDWNVPVAMPKSATEDGHGLHLVADFHSTPSAQEKRTIARERLEAGLTMGLSIGYGDVTAERLPDRRILKSIGRLFEVGLLLVPMNAEAGVSALKGIKAAADNVSSATYVLNTLNQLIESESLDADGGDIADATDVEALAMARDALLAFIAAESAEVGTTVDLHDVRAEDAASAVNDYGFMGRERAPFAVHIAYVEAGLKAVIARSHAVSRLRKEGRVLSSTNRSRLEELATALAAGEADIRDLLASTEPDAGKGLRIAEIEYLLGELPDLGLVEYGIPV